MKRAIETVAAKRKHYNTVKTMLKRKGFTTFTWADDAETVLEATDGIRPFYATVEFTDNGKAKTDIIVYRI